MKVFLCETIHPEAYRLLSEHAEINASRAGLVDEEALREALESGHLGGAASDVLKEEFPGADHPLLQFPNFVVTPHIGANTDEALYEVGMCCVRQILDVLAGKAAEYPVV